LLLDIDPIDKKDGATPEQLKAAMLVTKLTRKWFITHGCAPPHQAASGNGFHLLYSIDLPIERADDIHRLLIHLNTMFGTDIVKVDEVVFNPARVTRLYGTFNHKCSKPTISRLQLSDTPTLTEEQLDKLLVECPTVAEQEAYNQGKVIGVSEALDLAEVRATEEDRANPLTITPEVEEALVLWIIHSANDPQAPGYEYFSVILPDLKPILFNDPFNSLIFTCFTEYTAKYDHVPTTTILRSDLRESIAEISPELETEYLERFDKFIYKTPELSSLDWFRDQLNPALEHRAAKVAHTRMLGAVQAGEFAEAEEIWADRWKATNINDNYFEFMDVKDLINTPIKYEWIVEGLFAASQPTAIGGLQKSLKTGCICDLVASLATGTPFLGHFPVPKPFRVAYILAEGPLAEIRSRFATICNTRPEIEPGYANISGFKIKLSSEEELARMGHYCEKNNIEVVIIDPLYLTLLAGSTTDPASVYAMGDILATIGTWAEKAGITPILCHHFRIGCNPTSLDLGNFTYTGLQQFARQSFLIGRTEEWSAPNDNHMIFSHHGFARGGYYNLHVDEGEVTIDDDGKITHIKPWRTLVQAASKTHAKKTSATEARHEDKIIQFLSLEADENRENWHSKNKISQGTGVKTISLTSRLEALRDVGKIEVSDAKPPKFRLALDYHPSIENDETEIIDETIDDE